MKPRKNVSALFVVISLQLCVLKLSWGCQLLPNTTLVTIEALSTGCSNEQQHQNKQYSYIKINGHLCVINDSVVDVNLLNDTPSTRNAQRDTPPHILENILQRESLSTELNNNNIDNYANGNGNEDGIQMISISPNGHVKMHSISSPLTNVKDRIHALRFFKRIQNGSVVVIVTQNSCVLKYPAWPNMIKYTTALDVGPWHWRDSEQQQRDIGLIVGCYGYCPRYVFDKGTSQMTRSQIPFNIFSTAADVGKDDKNDGLLRYKIKFGLKGYTPESELNQTEVNFPTAASSYTAASNAPKTTLPDSHSLIIGISIGTLFFLLFLLICCCCRKKHRRETILRICYRNHASQGCKTKNSGEGGDSGDIVTATDGEDFYGMYAGLNTKRPSALPNNYEPLQKMSVQYEKIDSPAHIVFKFNLDKAAIQNNKATYDTVGEEEENDEEDHYQPSTGPFRLRSATELSAIFDVSDETLLSQQQRRLRANTELSVVSTSFGSSQNLFRKISNTEIPIRPVSPINLSNQNISAGNNGRDGGEDGSAQFATYVRLDSSEGIYKRPSGVPKFEPPKDLPNHMTVHRDSYVSMEGSKYDVLATEDEEEDYEKEECIEKEVEESEENYAPLSIESSDNECYEQLQFD